MGITNFRASVEKRYSVLTGQFVEVHDNIAQIKHEVEKLPEPEVSIAKLEALMASAATLLEEAGRQNRRAAVRRTSTARKVAPFFAQHRFAALKPYLDPKLGLSLSYQANLPTTIMLDSTGHEVWRRTGGTDWTSADAKAAIAGAFKIP